MIEKDLQARAVYPQVSRQALPFRFSAAGEQAVNAPGPIRIEKDVSGAFNALVIRPVRIAPRTVPRAGHGRVRILQFGQVVHRAQPTQEIADVTHGRLGGDERRPTTDASDQSKCPDLPMQAAQVHVRFMNQVSANCKREAGWVAAPSSAEALSQEVRSAECGVRNGGTRRRP